MGVIRAKSEGKGERQLSFCGIVKKKRKKGVQKNNPVQVSLFYKNPNYKSIMVTNEQKKIQIFK